MTNRNTLLTIIFINVTLLGILFAVAINYTQESASVVYIDAKELVAPIPISSQAIAPPLPQGTFIASSGAPPTSSATQLPTFTSEISLPSANAIGASPYQRAQESFNQLTLSQDPPLTDVNASSNATESISADKNPLLKSQEQPMSSANLTLSTQSDLLEVRVKSGDTLSRLAKAHHTTIEEIKKLNRLRSNQLAVGQRLKIPGTIATAKSIPPQLGARKEKEITSNNAETSQYYTVRPGDNPWKIATKHKMKLDQLLELNSLDQESAKQLKVGDKLRIK
jgi:LysM repeat protein